MGTQRAYQLSRVIVPALVCVAALWLLLARAAPAQAAGVVTSCGSDTDLRNKLAGGGLVTFNCNGTGSATTITVTAPLTLTSGQVTLDGGNNITLTGRNTNRIFFLNGIGSLSFTLTHIALTKGFDANAGGCLYAAAVRVYVDDVTVQQCSTAVPAGDGGGISNLFSDFQLVNSRVLSNTSGTGGGISTSSANIISLTNSLIAANQAITGGGLSVRAGTAFITGSTFSSNSANAVGGGIYIWNTGRATVLNSNLVLNKANGQGGGGIYNGNRLTLSGSLLSGNRAESSFGGGLSNHNIATVSNTTFDGNVATFLGGGIRNVGTLTLTQVLLNANATSTSGGGIANLGAVYVSASTLSGNTALLGGGIASSNLLIVTNVTVSGNTARADGGGIDNSGDATLTNVTLSSNTATNAGGGLFINFSGAVTLTYVTLSGNAANTGGGIVQDSGVMRLKSSIVANSFASSNCFVTGGTVTSDDYNLSDDDSCIPLFTQAHDLNQTAALLGPLANNGGPTLTHLPLAGSAVVDSVPVATNGCGTLIATDQRGVPRPQGNAKCDMGAVERAPGEQTPLLWLPFISR